MQKAQAHPRGSEIHVISNWNGTVELPAYDFGDQVLQEGSFGEAPALLAVAQMRQLPDCYAAHADAHLQQMVYRPLATHNCIIIIIPVYLHLLHPLALTGLYDIELFQ